MTDTFVTFVLDETGSMESIKDDTIGGFNSYVGSLRKKDEEAAFTLIKFDSNRHEVVHRAVPLKDVPDLTPEAYQPGAMTPLIDACYKAIKATEERAPEGSRVAIVIQTDGQENASREHTLDELAELVKEKTAAGWLFTFLGAGIDSFAQAGKMGISGATTIDYDRDRSTQTFASVAESTSRYMDTGEVEDAAFTNAERASASAKHGGGSSGEKAAKRKRRSLVDDIAI